MATTQKDTIYIDVDDEITAVIDKVQKSRSKIVALVLPKRAATLQSIVNMKLLKRAADDANKRAVLITSEAGLLPLAGAVGMYVAKNLQSKPEIPAAPETNHGDEELIDTHDPDEVVDPDKPSAKPLAASDAEETLDLEEVAPAAASAKAAMSSKPKKPRSKDGKRLKVPNFENFRVKMFLIIAAVIVLIVGWYFAAFVMPKATVVVTTDTSTENTSVTFTTNPALQAAEIDKKALPAKLVEVAKTDTQKATATGQRDLGAKASGKVDFTAPIGPQPIQIPAGTGVSTGGLTFLTQSAITLSPVFQGGSFKFVGSVNVLAQANGEQYNITEGKTFTVAGFSSVSGSNAAAMAGGVSKIVKVVSQKDIDGAKEKAIDNSQAAKDELLKSLADQNYESIDETFVTKNETITATPQVDQEGSEVTVTIVRTYSMVGVQKNDLQSLLADAVKDVVEEKQQTIQEHGLDKAIYRVVNSRPDGATTITIEAGVVLGPKIDVEKLKSDIAGKKRGDVVSTVQQIDGVKDVQVRYSPFWVSKTPKNTSKITLQLEKAD